LGYRSDGKPKYKTAYAKLESEAVDALIKIQTDVTLGKPISTERQTVSQFLDDWLESVIEGHKEPQTVRYYRLMVNTHIKPAIGRIDIRKLQALQVQELISTSSKASPLPKSKPGTKTKKAKDAETKKVEVKTVKTLSPYTVRGIRAVLRAALNHAWKLGMVSENVALKTTPPRIVKSDPVYLSPEDAHKLLEKAEGHALRNLLAVTLGTGMRVGEATGLRWQDIDFESLTLRIQYQLQRNNGKLTHKPLKSASSRRNLPILGMVESALRAEQERQQFQRAASRTDVFNPLELVFLNADARPLDPKYVDKHLKALCKEAGIAQVSFHKLRHTAATHMVAAGVPLALVKDQLGHSSITLTTGTYAHMVPAAQREAAEKLDLALKSVKANA